MTGNVRTAYRSMIRLQKLARTRHEMELSRLNAQFAVMEEENGTLFKMQDEQFEGNASFVPVHIIIRRLDANKILQTQLSAHIAGETRDLLKVSRMLDILNNRLSAFERASLRTEEAMEIDEHVGHLLAKHAI
ncbi:hypothetical protein CU102_14555 [Phyllobacterium brassicacearum]|uniref:Uncharacterized protein n=2 Tax=Phyllobacterium brassicacearum TaxID=314235 RepID=A0A2P7BNW0_9HYPH|nr:hypothetical protein CU102_14555 [Phyllobacterium brassicacearum]TDQ29625.1 hypothetical protein DEV91_109133 [Phyllobacterium brassicacearum]